MMLRRQMPRLLALPRPVQTFGILLTITTFIFMLRVYSRPPAPTVYDYTEGRTSPWREWNDTSTSATEEVGYLEYLYEEYGLTRDIPWFARRIRSTFKAGKRLSMTEVSSKFLSRDFRRVRIDDEYLSLTAESAIKMPFHISARPDQVDASELLFGISTTAARLSYSNYSLIQDWERWLTDGAGKSNGATLLLTLYRSSKEEVARIGRTLSERGIDATVDMIEMGSDATKRYADLARRLAKHGEALTGQGSEKKFYSLVDDDVFFPSMAMLLEKLSDFSPRKEFYIGAPSEKQSDWVTERNVTMTYGGGAVFVTPPMAEKMVALPCLESAGDGGSGDESSLWDEHIYKCVASRTKTNLHVLPSYYSPEDDLYGEYSAGNQGYGGGIQPLTLHHYKNWHRFEAGRGHQVTTVCGEECFLQRFHFRDDWILVNGYTLSQYPDGVSTVAVTKGSRLVSQSREQKRTPVSEQLVIERADRPNDMKAIAWAGPKRTWRLLDSRITSSGEVWQSYVKRKGASDSYGDVGEWDRGDKIHTDEQPANEDSVIVLIWEP
jgi:hypothetical protein